MLHGKIQINDTVPIVEWQAVRKESHGGDTHRYECFVKGVDLGGYPFEAEFDVYHSFKKGALYLASSILAEAHHRRRR